MWQLVLSHAIQKKITIKYLKILNLYSNTVHELNTVVMGNNFSPIVASRNYLYAAVAGYEVIAAGYPEKYNSLAGQLHGLKNVPKPTAGQQIDFEFAALLAYQWESRLLFLKAV